MLKESKEFATVIGKDDTAMSTSTFDRKIEIIEPESIRKLIAVMTKEAPPKPLSEHPYTDAERKRSEHLLMQCILRSRPLQNEN